MNRNAQSAGSKADDIEIRHCHTLAHFDQCVELERTIWGEQITVPSAIFVVAQHTGGHILGAFDSNQLVGFTLALAGNRGGMPFLHSHMTGVLPGYQDRSIGRRLKLFQRDVALKQNISLIEWTFDPLELRNAHFNFARLGAVARRFIPNCYGITDSGLHASLPTDRFIAEWWLDSPRVQNILAGKEVPVTTGTRIISLPSAIGEIKSTDRAAAETIQTRLRTEFQQSFREGFVVTGVESRPDTMNYVLQPAASIAGLRLPEYRPDEFDH
jgi:predicted GNAT superfamily acetyltransferase